MTASIRRRRPTPTTRGQRPPATSQGPDRHCGSGRNHQRRTARGLADRFRIEVIDRASQPHLARHDDIVVLPTLVRQLRPPIRKIIGDLSNEERVLVGLDVRDDEE